MASHDGDPGWLARSPRQRDRAPAGVVDSGGSLRSRGAKFPSAACIADSFPEEVRFRVYARIAYDRSGRNAQLVEACPGAFAFGIALDNLSGHWESIGERFWRGIATGIRLNRVLDDALESWLPAWTQGCRDEDVRLHLEARPAAVRAETLRAKRWLIRRAHPAVAPADLIAPPPVTLFPEDVTGEPVQGAAWFRVMSRPLFITQCAPDDREAHACLLRWASRMALPLDMAARDAAKPFASADQCGRWLDRALGDILDFLRATGRRPHRTTDPAEVIQESERWHLRGPDRTQAELSAMKTLGLESFDPTHPLPPPPFPDVDTERIAVVAIRTVGELIDEGLAQRHCVATYLPILIAGGLWIAKATIGGTRVTLEVHKGDGDGVEIVQARGFQNSLPSQEEKDLLAEWARCALHPVRSRASVPR